MSHPDDQSPVNPLPPVVTALFLLLAGVEAALWLGSQGIVGGPTSVGWRLEAIQRYAFSADIFDWMVATGQWPMEHVIRFVSYLFVHGNFTHALFGGVLLLAMGKMVGEVFSGAATLAIFLCSGAVGALGYAVVLNSAVPLLGSYPGVYGLIGAFTFLLWTRLGAVGAPQARAFSLIGMLVGIQLLFGLIFGGNPDWVADVIGFGTGFCLSFALTPGGWQRIREKIRRQ
ncbi:rhomboid family intramembrane serine protease [Shimia marina]|uniref:Rhomboid family protein n=1 Tax=Shimia marina TaxID=321267 RepID=A0A0P1EUQ7_9RHOB|nr:rhomboid family intramembrane serine protease [Shimia marina]CUH54323.1 Rhomboid family protein [Shimia marina]SFE00526.1 Membrane associated serine protease, rhomboid family [Shimia marina]